MPYLRSVRYDTTTRVLRAVYTTPSLSSTRVVEYADVAPSTFAEVRAAMPHGRRVIDASVAPSHPSRRGALGPWRPPAPRPTG